MEGVVLALIAAAATRDAAIDFDRQIRPILSNHCYRCHGPDGNAREADLRLDLRETAFAPRRGGAAAIVPGDRDAGRLWRRVTHADPGARMPPAEANKPLSDEQIALLGRWIDAGAPWSDHWAFTTPADVAPPAVRDESWLRNDVDRFVLARLEREGLSPSPAASRETLTRRASFGLTGLPPTLDEIDAFVTDERVDAWSRVVDGLLDSPRYGERMAVDWLDAARYADTHGYHYDNGRTMWVWRDWVIDAYNANLPYDRFAVEQLAGDLLPDASGAQRIATGFNRNHPITWEGGVIPEEYRVEYVVDRVNTTATVFMGLTMTCARCHDHKFDPISQEEFYRFAAFFNSIPEKGADGLEGNAVPFIAAPDETQAETLDGILREAETLEARRTEPHADLDAAQSDWETAAAAAYDDAWTVLAPFSATTGSKATLTARDDHSLWAEGPHAEQDVYEIVSFTGRTGILAVRLEAMADSELPGGGPGRASHSNFLLSEFEVEAASLADPSATTPIRFVAAHADHSQPNFFVSRAIDGERTTGWAVNRMPYGEDRIAIFVAETPFGFEGGTALKVRLRFESDYTRHAMGRVRLAIANDADLAGPLTACALSPWQVAGPFGAEGGKAAYETAFAPEGEGSVEWRDAPELVNGKVHGLEKAENSATYLRRTIDAPTARPVRFSFGSDDAIKVWLNGELVHASDAPRGAAPDQDLVTIDVPAGVGVLLVKIVNYGGEHAMYFDKRDDHALDPPPAMASILTRPAEERTETQRTRLRDWFRARHDPQYDAILAQLASLRRREAEVRKEIPTVMVMQAMDEPRPTHTLERGRYDMPRDEVTPGVPSVLPPLADGDAPPRLRLAEWLVQDDHPLTARVAVNRIWRQHVGRGLVETDEDFGVQGRRPTHPELLDWLARWFVEHDWDVKALHRLILDSATYRQGSTVTPLLRDRDPANTLLARGPRFRLSAEMIRDGALAASGLLVERVGGPPVKPYQPEGLWKEVGSDVAAFSANVYVPDTGDALYRRTLYTFWKRTLPPPALAVFDAPTREFCVVRRSRTNTPLQALVTLNDPTYVEAARALAQRIMTEADDDAAARATLGFRLVTARNPSRPEIDVLVRLYDRQLRTYRDSTDQAVELLEVGDSMPDDTLPPEELAAWTVVASVLLNLDEALTTG